MSLWDYICFIYIWSHITKNVCLGLVPETKNVSLGLDSQILKDCIKCNDSDEKILNDFFENELQEEMNRVFNDMNEDIEDSVDLELKRNFAKKIKYCEEGHRNNIQRKNRKYCNIGNCKSILKDNEQNDEVPDSIGEKDPALSASEYRSLYYMSLPNINSEKVEEVPIGAIPINPNNKERVQKCLD